MMPLQPRFSIRDMLETFQSCKMLERPKTQARESVHKDPIDWWRRQIVKNILLKKYLISTAIITISCLVLVVLPFSIAYIPFGKALLLAMPPMLIISLSWSLATWWAFDKGHRLLYSVTVGAAPLRIAFGLGWVLVCAEIPGINIIVLVLGMMIFWSMLMVPEVMLFFRFSQNLEPTAEIEPKK